MAAAAETTTVSADVLLRRRDVHFLLDEWLGLGELCARDRYREHSGATFADVLSLAERIAAERFAPHARRADEQEPQLDGDGVALIPEIGAALAAHAEAGFISMTMDEAIGGAQLPHLLATACRAWFAAANPGTAVYNGLTASAANLIAVQGSDEQRATWLPPLLEGRFFGTMCLSETQAGSALADITTRAEPQADGTHRLFGSKMWIGAGEHPFGENIVHLVLARLPGAPAGTTGISLFIVPKWLVDEAGAPAERNDVVVAGINHKMGQRGTVNTVLGFGEGLHSPGGMAGAVGYLVGEPNRGLAGMFHMMNEARLEVGTVATGLGYTAYLRSLQYARERLQGRPIGAAPDTAPVPIVEHADVRRMLLAQKSYVEGGLALVLYAARLLDDTVSAADPAARERAGLLLTTLTPIVKSWPSQWCLAANDLAIQVHGGYGYARDYEVERLYRDNRISAIYEGTHGIQALDLVGRHVFKFRGAGVTALLEEMAVTIARGAVAGGDAAALASSLGAAVAGVQRTTAGLADAPDVALAQATAYLEALGHVVVAWLWLEQVLACDGKVDAFYDGKRAAARYFFRYELPRVAVWLDLLDARDRTTLDLDVACL